MQSALPQLLQPVRQPSAAPSRVHSEASVPLYIYAVVFSSLCIVWGLLWDIMWHMSIGRDGLLSPPHVVMYVGAVVAGLFSGYQILDLTFRPQHPDRAKSVRFWGVFYGSLGALYCVWGALSMLTSAPFDDWWHNTYGLDVKILSPPHTVLLLGMMMVQFGAMIGVLALQNRYAASASLQSTPLNQRLKLLFVVAAGLLLAVLFILLSEKLGRWASHHSSYYVTAALAFPFFLLAVGRASMLRYPITTITAIYMLSLLIPNWVLPLFPATPRLGPVLNPITHYQPFQFPWLLVVPGFALDKLLYWNARPDGSRRLNDWWLAALAAGVFVGVALVVQWPFGQFLVESPNARNRIFLSYSWFYSNDPHWPYRYQYSPGYLQTAGAFAKGIGVAIGCAFVSARIGLWWGNWMKRVVR